MPVEERDENGKKRLTGGKDNDRGTPQGGVISPLLANLYMNRMLKGWRQTKRGEQFQAHIVITYADDFVILSRGKAAEALDWTRRRGDAVGADSEREEDEHQESARRRASTFWGTHSGRTTACGRGRGYLGCSPSKKSVARIKEKVGDLLMPQNVEAVGGGARSAESDVCEAGEHTSAAARRRRRIGRSTSTL